MRIALTSFALAALLCAGPALAEEPDLILKCAINKSDNTHTDIFFKSYNYLDISAVIIYNSKGEEVYNIQADRFTGANGVGNMYGHKGGDGDGYINSATIGAKEITFSYVNSDDRSDYLEGSISRVTGAVWLVDHLRSPGIRAEGSCEPADEIPTEATKF
jgi:hypothetical protein